MLLNSSNCVECLCAGRVKIGQQHLSGKDVTIRCFVGLGVLYQHVFLSRNLATSATLERGLLMITFHRVFQ